MVFSSAIFIFFFLPSVIILYNLIPVKLYKNILISIVSIIFYSFGQIYYLPLLLLSVFCNYIFGIILLKFNSYRKLTLVLAVIFNIGLLSIFKYLDFLINNINKFSDFEIPLLNISLPIGISFFTFQGLSYVIDVYRNREEGTTNFIKILLYISFFPQLVAGPIIKYNDISQEIDNRKCTFEQTAKGIRRFIIGLSKKMLIANTLGSVVDTVFSTSWINLDIRIAWLGAVCYLFQIYFDFSGYSDMAIGLGHMFGFHFKENFNFPYSAHSIKDFWRRWHISLSSWFRDYLYIPLGGNRHGKIHTEINKFIVFFLTGFWHGANWTFIFWGIWHGLLSIFEDIGVIPIKKIKSHILCQCYTILMVLFGFVIFRSKDILQAGAIFYQMFLGFNITPEKTILLQQLLTSMNIVVLILACIFSSQSILCVINRFKKFQGKSETISYVLSLVLFVLCIINLASTNFNPFIYFQF